MDRERNQGGRNGAAKFTEAQVIMIRERWDRGDSARQIQKEYAECGHYVSIETVRRIGRRETWGWLLDGGTHENPPVQTPAQRMEVEASLRKLKELTARADAQELMKGEREKTLSPGVLERRKGYLEEPDKD